jgi:hypothetical protein
MESKTKTAEEIMSKHFKECFETHNEKISEKYRLYFHKAMLEYANQEMEKAVNEFKEELLNNLPSPYIADDLYYIDRIKEVIEKLK